MDTTRRSQSSLTTVFINSLSSLLTVKNHTYHRPWLVCTSWSHHLCVCALCRFYECPGDFQAISDITRLLTADMAIVAHWQGLSFGCPHYLQGSGHLSRKQAHMCWEDIQQTQTSTAHWESMLKGVFRGLWRMNLQSQTFISVWKQWSAV